MRQDLPTGTVTFFFSDMEGSTRLVQELGDLWPGLLDDHDRLIRTAVSSNGGVEVRTEGDAFFAAFASAADAVAAAGDVQRAVASHEWPEDREVRVRIGLHTGAGMLGGADYVGVDVHRAARIAAAAHGGQVVLSETTAVLAERVLPEGTDLRDLGKHRLKDLLERESLFQLVIPGVSDEFPALRTLDAVPNNLPLLVTSFVGREDDVAEALRLLESRRIVTLLGPGGTGKTRLSLQVAAEAAERFPDGVYFVPLASVTDGDLIPSTVLASVGVHVASRRDPPVEQLTHFLADKSLLLVLDNFEQLVESAGIVAEMAARSPASKFLVTSRVPLRVSGEQELPIPPLETAAEDVGVETLMQIESIRLFLERAQTVRPDFELTAANAAAVAALVGRLDGLPLAIELVVPKLKLLPVERILERLDTRSLAGGARDAPERHQTLWNAISWSDESLPPACRRLFARLSVFVGGVRLDEIEKVCGPQDDLGVDVLEGLATLVDHSLVLRDDDQDRFRMLHVIREYAADRLAESTEAEVIRRRHGLAYCARVEEAYPELTRRDRKTWLESLDADLDNLRAALAHCVEARETDAALRLVWSMWRYWQIRGHLYEARRRVDEVLALPGGDPMRRAKAVEALGGIAWWQGDADACEAAYQEALRLQLDLGDQREIANALYNKGLVDGFFREDSEAGRRSLDEALGMYESLGDVGGLADVHWGLGNLLMIALGEPAEGITHFERSIAGYQEVGNVFGEGWAHFELGEAARRLRQFDTARAHYSKGLELLYAAGDVSATVLFVMAFAALALEMDDQIRTFRLAGAAYGAADRSGVDLISVAVNRIEGLERAALEAVTDERADAYRQGAAMSYDQAVEYALEGA
jgi:predicted ATPase/class 3 adenylate cyclase